MFWAEEANTSVGNNVGSDLLFPFVVVVVAAAAAAASAYAGGFVKFGSTWA